MSENEDDPAYVYESSGSDWDKDNSIAEPESRRRSLRSTSIRNNANKTAKKEPITPSSTSDEEIQERKTRKRNGLNKKQKLSGKKSAKKHAQNKKDTMKDYATGSFLILKRDAQVGDPSKPPCVWRIDGKALLQKYEPFEECGKVRHKTTSVYTGWSVLEKELYAPISANISANKDHVLTIDINWNALKYINIDSD